MNDIERLIAAESIRKTKARYWYFLDMKMWRELGTTFTRDVIVDFRGERDVKPGGDYNAMPPVEKSLAEHDVAVQQGRDTAVKFIKDVVENWVTVHQGAAPIIDVTGPDSAKVIWPFFDYIDDGRHSLQGYGYYHETFRVEDGEWRIASFQLRRLRWDGTHPFAPVEEAAAT